MKIATLKDGTRDGQLVVVSRDLHTAVIADAIAPTLQRVIEDWAFYAPQLVSLYEALNAGRARRAFGFDPADCMAPLARTYRLLGRPAPLEDDEDDGDDISAESGPWAARRADSLLGAQDDILLPGERTTVHFDAGLAVLLSDIAPGGSPARAADAIRLLMLTSAFSTSMGLAPVQYDNSAFSPVAVTADELGAAWQDSRLRQALDIRIDGRPVDARHADGRTAGKEGRLGANVDFSQIAARAARAASVTAGTLIAGTDRLRLEDCLGSRIRVELTDEKGGSICGAIEQSIVSMSEAE